MNLSTTIKSLARWGKRGVPAWFVCAPLLSPVFNGLAVAAEPVQNTYLKASNTDAGDLFGAGVACDGDTMVIGAPFEASAARAIGGNQSDNTSSYQGAAYVYVKTSKGWIQQAYLKGSNSGSYDQFGAQVAISGNTIVIGAARNHGPAGEDEMGAAYVFVRNGNTWSQQALLRASNGGGGDNYGAAVSISENTVVVGAPYEDANTTGVNGNGGNNDASASGAAYVYTRNGSVWTQQAYLKASHVVPFQGPEYGMQFGDSVSISGNDIVVGAPEESGNATGVNGNQNNSSIAGAGAAYVFSRNGTAWTQQAYLKATAPGQLSRFGRAVSVSNGTVVVGAPGHLNSSGAAYVFKRDAGTWTGPAYLRAGSPAAVDFFGSSVAVENDVVLVGAPSAGAGSAYLFARLDNAWSQRSRVLASNGGIGIGSPAGDRFGNSVSLGGDTFVVGASYEDSGATGINGNQLNDNASEAGAGYIFTGVPKNIDATFSSTASVPVVSEGYDATANSITFTLGFAPSVGTALTVIDNTGLAFIKGTFTNLAQGQEVTLVNNGVSYRFVANYYGGTGNDLVLQWADVRPVGWGENGNGELGNNSVTNSSVPVAVVRTGALAGKTIISVASGGYHSLALCSDGTLAAWGANTHGQLGNNSSTGSKVPVAVLQNGILSGKRVIAISAGDTHSLALCSDGTVAAWGWNAYGELGDNSTTDSKVPVAVLQNGVLAGKNVIAVSAGYLHSIALCSDGTLAAWGGNTKGQLGNDSTTNSKVPVAVFRSEVLAGKSVIAASAGGYHSVALCSDGTMLAWGQNFYGELGNGSTADSPIPVAVVSTGVLAGKTVIAAAGGAGASVALSADGMLAAWGSNFAGGLGNNSRTNSPLPVAVVQNGVLAGKSVIAVSKGAGFNLAICSDGTAASWGSGLNGQLGDGSGTDSLVPIKVSTAGLSLGERFVRGDCSRSGYHVMALVASPPKPPSISVSSGSNQSTVVNRPFDSRLAVLVKDYANNPVSGVTVTFTAPASGPGGMFAGENNTAVTDETGTATSSIFTANNVAGGPYTVTASAAGAGSTAFSLTNALTVATHFAVTAPAGAAAGESFDITVTALDQFENVVTDYNGTSHFTCTDAAAAGILPADYSFTSSDAGTHRFIGEVTFVTAAVQTITATDTIKPAVTGTSSEINTRNGPPARIIVLSGTPQLSQTKTSFPLPLVAVVRDAFGNPAADEQVTFAAPGSRATCSFGAGQSIATNTDSQGIASSGTVTAGAANGSYTVIASVRGVNIPAVFALSNGTVKPTGLQLASTGKLDKQTGLFDLVVRITNTTPEKINGFRLNVDYSAYLKKYPGLRLYNASRSFDNGMAYIDYRSPVAVDGKVKLKLSFYTRTRQFPASFKPMLVIESPDEPTDARNPFATCSAKPKTSPLPGGAVRIIFPAVSGRCYRLEFTNDSIHWQKCPVTARAVADHVQWTDKGLPLTDTSPTKAPFRSYRIIEISAP